MATIVWIILGVTAFFSAAAAICDKIEKRAR